MISVRLPKETEYHLDRVASLLGHSRSELVRIAIEKYLEKYQKPSAWELGESLFGRHGSGRTDKPEEFVVSGSGSSVRSK